MSGTLGYIDQLGHQQVVGVDNPLPVNVIEGGSGGTTGGATAANQTAEIGYLSTIATNTAGGSSGTPTGSAGSPNAAVVSVQGISGGTVVPVSGTFWQATQPVSGTVTAAQGTAASLNATVVGTGTFAAQLTGSSNNINNIAGTVSLPTGASTSALQTTGNTALSAIETAVQGTLAVSAVSLPLPTGAATAANQATEITSLASIVTNTAKTPSLGQATQANSVPVTLASNPDIRPGQQSTTAADAASTTTAGNNSVNYITGTPTAGSTFVQTINGISNVSLSVSTITATVSFELSVDGTVWIAATMRQRGSSYTASSATGIGIFEGDVGGKAFFRVRQTTAGGATFTPIFTAEPNGIQVMNPVKLFDNTNNTQAIIKPASTSSVATDTAIVVSQRPGDNVTVVPYPGTITQTIVTLSAATSAPLIASNAARKGLRWMNTGANPMTVVPGATAAVANAGMNFNPQTASGFQGGSQAFEGMGVPTNAFQAISTLGTTITVWETT